MKIWKIAMLMVLPLMYLLFPLKAYAEVPYKTYTVDGYGYVTETQTAYIPKGAFTKVGDHALVKPMDLKISKDGLMYIADAGAAVIWVCTLDGEYVDTIGEGELKEPYGIFITDDNTLYVADHSGKVVVFNKDKEIIAVYTKPEHPLYGNAAYKPIKLVVNAGGDMYIVSEGNSNGLVQLSAAEGGTFLGYFGTNMAQISVLRTVQEALFTETQLSRLTSNLPKTPFNVAIDDQGLIYTITPGERADTLKKMNIAGTNMISSDTWEGKETAIEIGNHDNIYIASSDGYIFEYNAEGQLLFVFGGRDDGRFRIGLSSRVEGIAVDAQDNIYIVDSDSKKVQYFEATEFTDLLHSALNLYERGRYRESMEPLLEVLEMNSLFDYANEAISRSYLQAEDYENAMRYARVSKAYDVYSDAFWEVRNTWLRNNLVTTVGAVIGICVVIWVLRQLHRRRGIFDPVMKITEPARTSGYWQRLKYMAYYMRHPVDGAYGLRYEGKSSWITAFTLIVLITIIYNLNKYRCGFLLRTVREGRYTIGTDAMTIIGVFVLLTICNYLMCTINDGEGSFKRLFCGFAFSLAPYILLQPISILISNVITYNEVFLIDLGQTFIFAWVAILIFITIKEVNNYSVKETFKCIFLTIFTLLIVCLVAFILYVLAKQIFDFVKAILGEAVYRIGI